MIEPISGMKHPAFRDALALTHVQGRLALKRYLVEDLNLTRQALQSSEPVFGVFATPPAATELEPLCQARDVPLYSLSHGLLHRLIGVGYETAVNAAAIVGQKIAAPEALLVGDALLLCGERIQDPRNVGVLIRTADAIGAAGLLLTGDSADPWQRQSMRSTTGSLLRLPLAFTDDLTETLRALRARGARVIASTGSAQKSAAAADLSARPLILVVGNEQDGLTSEILDLADERVALPMAKGTGADSYNVTVAAGMLLYEAWRQRASGGSAPEPHSSALNYLS